MPPAFDVLVCGSLHLDIVVKAKTLPRVDETAVGSAWAQVCGGKGGNQAVQAARAGARTAIAGCTGQDAFGETLRANLRAEGVDISALTQTAAAGSGMSVAILQEDGDYGAVIVSGANLLINPDALPDIWHRLGGASVVVLQNEIPHAVNLSMARLARSQGAKVVFNAAPARPDMQEVLQWTDVLVVNRIEAEAMFGVPVTSRADARAALSSRPVQARAVIITLGGDGLVLATPEGEVIDMAAIPVTVTSTHGAGDCFIGTLAARLAQGQSLPGACRHANQSAATFVSRTT